MSVSQDSVPNQEVQKTNDKEYNFAQLRKQAEAERNARLDAERRLSELEKQFSSRSVQQEDDYSDEPYVDQKFLNKKLASFEKTIDQRIEERAEQKAKQLLEMEKREQYLQRNNDFNSVMSPENLQKLAEADPELAQSLLSMPDTFERQKLVYRNIKNLGLDKPKAKELSIQEKIDANRRTPYYQPSGQPSAPYSNGGDFSEAGQKAAYLKMQETKKRLGFR